MYGLVDRDTGLPHQKGTGMLLSSKFMKENLSQLCDGSHTHALLEGQKTKRAQQWPEPLCKAILDGANLELQGQVVRFAFPAEFEIEESEAFENMDGIHDVYDLAEPPMKRAKVDLNELDTEEDYEQYQSPEVTELIHQKENHRREQWLRLPREKRVALRRLHQMMGHCSNQALIRMLKSSMAGKSR